MIYYGIMVHKYHFHTVDQKNIPGYISHMNCGQGYIMIYPIIKMTIVKVKETLENIKEMLK